jgi:hypothetical protein
MKNLIQKIVPAACLILIFYVFTACSKDDKDTATLKTGDWYGEGISFTVGSDPLRISNLEFTYSGYAAGTICSYDYESGASFSTVAGINDRSFDVDLSTFNISGTFLTDSTAEIEIVWLEHDATCDATKTGDKTFTAVYNLPGKSTGAR